MLISKSEFARRMKVSAAAGQSVSHGRLSVIEGKWLDEKVAVLQWDLNRQRLPPPPRITSTAPTALSPPVDWTLENTGMWIVLTRNRSMVPPATQAWLELATGRPADPRLAHHLTGLLQEIAGCVERMTNPDPDEDFSE
ncbi:MAG: hypothetical protein IPL99_00745 [Candidatus Competibacteraceae bacterium]|nr:hypothetical protein [Candidatus Competibacteraceae bacterium]